jgi:hypothetical protein
MASIIVTPAELAVFAKSLRDKLGRMSFKSKQLATLANSARATWRDDKYHRFHKNIENITSELDLLIRQTTKYADYLDEKAKRARKYLENR